MTTNSLLIIDFEFTMPEGKYSPQNFFPEIIEAGIVKSVDDEVVETFSSYVRPKIPEADETLQIIFKNNAKAGRRGDEVRRFYP